jgi:hypothetical protein
MRKLFLLACLSATTLLSCKKEDKTPKEPCEISNIGYLRVINSTVNDFQVYVDGDLRATSYSGGLQSLNIDSGLHVIKVVNYSNTNDTRINSVEIFQCGDLKYYID